MKWMQFWLVWLNPIFTAVMLIPTFLFIKTIAIGMWYQIAIALFFVLFMVILPALAAMAVFNGEIKWYSTMHQKSVVAHVVTMSISLLAYALGIAFFVPFIS